MGRSSQAIKCGEVNAKHYVMFTVLAQEKCLAGSTEADSRRIVLYALLCGRGDARKRGI
jgi:hypothetical protein